MKYYNRDLHTPYSQCYFEWPWVTLGDLAKYSMPRIVARSLRQLSFLFYLRLAVIACTYCPCQWLVKTGMTNASWSRCSMHRKEGVSRSRWNFESRNSAFWVDIGVAEFKSTRRRKINLARRRVKIQVSCNSFFASEVTTDFGKSKIHKAVYYAVIQFLSASLYISKRGAYWDRLCRDVVGRWLVGCHARALWPNGAS